MIDVFFSDDAQQARPYREGMGSLVATGYLHVPGEAVRDLEQRRENLCMESGFPKGRAGQFKWSPGRELWMYSNLKFEGRADFFRKALALAAEATARVTVIVEDQTRGTATGADNHQFDVTKLLIERVEWRLNKAGKHGVIVVDRPAGDREDEAKFLVSCLRLFLWERRTFGPSGLLSMLYRHPPILFAAYSWRTSSSHAALLTSQARIPGAVPFSMSYGRCWTRMIGGREVSD